MTKNKKLDELASQATFDGKKLSPLQQDIWISGYLAAQNEADGLVETLKHYSRDHERGYLAKEALKKYESGG